MTESILNSVKEHLGIFPTTVTDFDNVLIDDINTIFSILKREGVGPAEGFKITGSSEVWSDFTSDDKMLGMARTLVPIRVKAIFDPPSNSSAVNAANEIAKELEWSMYAENPY